MLYVDGRWSGAHGIGRFSREVVPRLGLPHHVLRTKIPPASPLDVFNPDRLRLAPGSIVYNPGYNAGPTAAMQILTIHDLIHLTDPQQSTRAKRSYYETVVRRAVLRASVVMTVSEVSRMVIEDWLRAPRVRVVNVGNGCSPVFRPEGKKMDDEPYFLYVGNLKSHKNFGVLVKALRKRPNYRLIVVCQDADGVNAIAAQNGLNSQIVVRPGLSDEELATYYRGALGLLIPSKLEGFGLPAVEAMACGTPVVSWEGCPSLAEIRNGTGIGVESADDHMEWAAAMDALFDSVHQSRIQQDPLWREKYEWSSVATNVEDLLRAYA